jgi:hypothetical protein
MRLRGLVCGGIRAVSVFAVSQRSRARLAALRLALQEQRNRLVPRHARPLPRQHIGILTAFMAGLALERQKEIRRKGARQLRGATVLAVRPHFLSLGHHGNHRRRSNPTPNHAKLPS